MLLFHPHFIQLDSDSCLINERGWSGELEAWISVVGSTVGVSAGESTACVWEGVGRMILCVMVIERDALGN